MITTPAGPYQVGVLGTGRLGTAGCVLDEPLDATETAVDVTRPRPGAWSATAVPYDVIVFGEVMTVTAVSGAGPDQTLTVTRSVNGVVKTHPSGAPVRLLNPIRLAH